MARGWVRRLFEQGLGAPGRALLAWRTRGQAERLLASRGLSGPARALAKRLGERVVRGPFAGMQYPRRRGDIVHAAKLIGAYELELHAPLERLISRTPTLVVNIGSGDGFYAVGLARRLGTATIVAVDPDPLAQRACTATAELNGVDRRVVHRDRCTAELLNSLAIVPARMLVVADCEGCEDELLDPVVAPNLAFADLLVETHDFAVAGVRERLTRRFSATHDVEVITISPRRVRDFPELTSDSASRDLLDEFRHMPQDWLVCVARAR